MTEPAEADAPAPTPPPTPAPTPGRRWGRRRLVSVAIGIVLAVGLWIGLTVSSAPGPTTAPSFSLPRLGGGAVVAYPLTGKMVGRPVVVTFFASWCGPCHAELPMIAEVARHEETSGAKVVFLGVDGNDDPASGLAFARKSGVGFVVGADADSVLAPRFTLVGYPGTVFIDGSGKIIKTVDGPVSRTTLESYLARLS